MDKTSRHNGWKVIINNRNIEQNTVSETTYNPFEKWTTAKEFWEDVSPTKYEGTTAKGDMANEPV